MTSLAVQVCLRRMVLLDFDEMNLQISVITFKVITVVNAKPSQALTKCYLVTMILAASSTICLEIATLIQTNFEKNRILNTAQFL